MAHIGKRRKAYRVLVGKSEGKRLLGRPRYVWVCNVKMDLKEIEWEVVNWSHLAEHRAKWQALVKVAIMYVWIFW